jgi:TIR domain
MTDIFFSWASPDRSVANLIIGRLLDAGLPVGEYEHGMVAGDDIPQWVVNRIERARIVVACVSEAALAHSEWVKGEVGLAGARYLREDNPLERLVVIRIGHVPDGWQSPFVPQNRLRYFDITDVFDADELEAQVEELVGNLRTALGLRAPVVIPAALYAMTSAEFAELGECVEQPQLDRLVALCRGVGMPGMPDLWDELSKRHGATDQDFTPYADEQTLIQLTRTVVGSVNERRMDNNRNPVYLRWYSRAELSQKPIRDLWRNKRTVLFVDSVSSLYPAVFQCLLTTPQPKDARKAAVICLPPYTRHTGELERLIEDSLEGRAILSDNFRAWRGENDLTSLAFDLPTETSMKRWLDQLLLADFQREPVPEKRDRMPDADRTLPVVLGVPRSLR